MEVRRGERRIVKEMERRKGRDREIRRKGSGEEERYREEERQVDRERW